MGYEDAQVVGPDYLGIILGVLIVALVLFLVFYFFKRRYKQTTRIKDAQKLVMLQVLMPKLVKKQEEKEGTREDFKQQISLAEQLFSAISSIYKKDLVTQHLDGQERISFEIVAKKKEIYFFVGVPKDLQGFVEKQIYAIFPDAYIESSNDFKMFTSSNKIKSGQIKLAKKFVYPIKTYKSLETDPVNSITNALSKISDDAKATIQILIRPTSGNWKLAVRNTAKSIVENKTIRETFWEKFFGYFIDAMSKKENEKKAFDPENKLTPIQEETLKSLREKQAKVGFKTQLKVVVSAPTEEEASESLNHILDSYAQFESPEGNRFEKKIINNDSDFITSFILREFTTGHMILNTEELASIYHFPNNFTETPNIKWLKSRILPAPSDTPNDGVFLGENIYRGETRKVFINEDDRRRHVYMVGKTGTGKTTLFLNMIRQDIKNGKGCCFIDPNGDAALEILKFIPKERAEDIIYFDPSDIDRPMGLNLLEWSKPEDKDFLVSEWLNIFQKLFDPGNQGFVGPQFEHWGRNAALTIMAQPGGGSLLEIPRLFVDDSFREKCISYVKDPVVLSFWNQQMAKTSDFHKSEMYNYFISKFGRFMTNDLMRNVIGQRVSAFDFRKVMDDGKILIVNLSKGKLGETNSYMLGMIMVAKIQAAAFGRADIDESQRRDFYLYVDEFQNFTTESFKTILSEARKYRLNLAVAHQYIQQLAEPIRDACLGNAGTIITYRVGAHDAEYLVKEFPGVSEQDFTNLPFGAMYIKLLVNGSPSKPFTMQGIKPDGENTSEFVNSLRELSRIKFGKAKDEVEKDIRERTQAVETDKNIDEVSPSREAGV